MRKAIALVAASVVATSWVLFPGAHAGIFYTLIFGAFFVLGMKTAAARRKERNRVTQSPVDVPVRKVPQMTADGKPRLIDGDDRSAGRWCAECQQHGSHHTDRHEDFLYPGV